jgi:hypothetical protein
VDRLKKVAEAAAKEMDATEVAKVDLIERLEKTRTREAFQEYEEMVAKKDFEGIKRRETSNPSWAKIVERGKNYRKKSQKSKKP